MADNNIFHDASALFGPEWQATKVAMSERGEWFMILRIGPAGLQNWCWGHTPEAALDAALEHVEAVRALMRAARARRLAKAPQDYDTSTLPLFGDSMHQMSLF